MRSDAVSTRRGKAGRWLAALGRFLPDDRERLWRPALLLAVVAAHVALLLWLALLFAVGLAAWRRTPRPQPATELRGVESTPDGVPG